MKFFSLLAVPALFVGSFAAPVERRQDVDISIVVNTLQGLLQDVTSATGAINNTVAADVNAPGVAISVQVNLKSILQTVNQVVATVGVLPVVNSSTAVVTGQAGSIVATILQEVQGTISGVSQSGLDLSLVTDLVGNLVQSLTGLLGGLQNLGLTTIVGTVTNLTGSLPIVGQVTGLLGGVTGAAGTTKTNSDILSGLLGGYGVVGGVLGGIVRK